MMSYPELVNFYDRIYYKLKISLKEFFCKSFICIHAINLANVLKESKHCDLIDSVNAVVWAFCL